MVDVGSRKLSMSDFTLITSTGITESKFLKRAYQQSRNTTGKETGTAANRPGNHPKGTPRKQLLIRTKMINCDKTNYQLLEQLQR